MSSPGSLYVHIPFCKHICAYCDFAKVFYQEKWADDYLERLAEELKARDALRPFKTVYIGGGSPSALNERQLEKLLALLKLPVSRSIETTIEVNPEDLSESKALLMRKAGVSRVSLGVQTFQKKLLERIGRHHDLETVHRAVNFLKAAGIPRISFDFIYGLPDQTFDDFKADLKILEQFPEVGHVSFYTLILEEHTRFYHEHIQMKDDQWLIEAQQLLIVTLEKMGFRRYEVSNFAKSGEKSLHNLVYWHNQHYIGVGCGASGYIDNLRYDNTRSLTQYLKNVTTASQTRVSYEDQMFEEIMLGLRLVEGVSLTAFEARYGKSLIDIYGDKLQKYLSAGLLVLENNTLKTSTRGMDVLDEILLSLM